MRRAVILGLLVLTIGWVTGPFLYRASWAITAEPIATRATYPLPSVTPSTVRVFHLDTTQAEPGDPVLFRLPPPPKRDSYRKRCPLSPPEHNADIILLGTGGGQALASAALPQMPTTVVDLIVEPGERPLYLVLSSWRNIIWRVEGASERVSKVVLLASSDVVDDGSSSSRVQGMTAPPVPPRYAGVTGIEAGRVTTMRLGACFNLSDLPREDLMRSAAVSAEVLFGRTPTVMAAGHRVSAVRLPSGRAATMQIRTAGVEVAQPAALMPYRGMEAAAPLTEWPGGLVAIQPGEVVSAVPVRPYVVLPGAMGLKQLIEAGEVRRFRRGRKVEYQVRRPVVALPSGMSPWSVFVLEPWVPVPKQGSGCVRRRMVVGLPFTYATSRQHCLKPL